MIWPMILVSVFLKDASEERNATTLLPKALKRHHKKVIFRVLGESTTHLHTHPPYRHPQSSPAHKPGSAVHLINTKCAITRAHTRPSIQTQSDPQQE